MIEKIEAKVMLVNSEKEFLDMLSQRLDTKGLNPDCEEIGADAVRENKRDDFGAIVVDLAMPDIEGFEILKRMKEKGPDLEICVLPGKLSLFWI